MPWVRLAAQLKRKGVSLSSSFAKAVLNILAQGASDDRFDRLGDVVAVARGQLPQSRRGASVNCILIDARLDRDTVTVQKVQVGFVKQSRSFFRREEIRWVGWVEHEPKANTMRLMSSGVFDAQSQKVAELSSGALTTTTLRAADQTIREAVELVPASHRDRGPLHLDLRLACESAGPRWRLQYEVDNVGFRVLHLDAETGAAVHDHFDEAIS